ncbi:MAG: hypothetical protein IPJ09_15300 [Saprospiraceae bacterium]|nr:hypothetical protein [Saprospiraceae bacterium]
MTKRTLVIHMNRSSEPNKYLFLIILILCCSCVNPTNREEVNDKSAEDMVEASLNAVGNKSNREKIMNLISMADCISPDGKYTTEIHTAVEGYSFFKQVYSYKPETFEAVIEKKIKGYSFFDSVRPLSREAVYSIRSHEFQNIVLELNERYHDFEVPTKGKIAATLVNQVKAKDELNHPCLLSFDHDTRLLTAIEIQNPDTLNEVLTIKFSNWKKIENLLMPYHVVIDQSGKNYVFNFIKLQFNIPDFEYK